MKAWIARTALYTGLALTASGIISTTGAQFARRRRSPPTRKSIEFLRCGTSPIHRAVPLR
jgi:hypothetical protein